MIIRSFPLMLILLKHSHFNLSIFNFKYFLGRGKGQCIKVFKIAEEAGN